MVMQPALGLSLGQRLAMTPQLQRAIRLLQLSQVELQTEIRQMLDSNVMLEEFEEDELENDDNPQSEEEAFRAADHPEDETREDSETQIQTHQGEEADTSAEADAFAGADNLEPDGERIPDTYEELLSGQLRDDLPVDCAWEDTLGDFTWTSLDRNNPELFADNISGEALTLQDQLIEQLNLLNLSDRDRLIATAIVDALDGKGMLTQQVEELCQGLADDGEPIHEREAEAVLHLIQHLDPVGIAARSLQECLLIQLEQLPPETPWLKEAVALISCHHQYLANRNYNQLMRVSRLSNTAVAGALTLIRKLHPRPGETLARNQVDYVEPDVLVSRHEGSWRVELNPKTRHGIRVNQNYTCLIRKEDSSPGNTYMKQELQEARWFLRSLLQRDETLLKVAGKIVEFQQPFLEQGHEAMKPLVLHDIAEAVDLHESTISRVITNKYMCTPAGLFEFRHFFSSHISTEAGGVMSSTAIRALIKKLVAGENPIKPLSDNSIASLLGDRGIPVARRTVAKYRELLMIPPSNERKQLI